MTDYNQHFYKLALACNTVRLSHGEDRTLAADNSIVDHLLLVIAKAHGFESYPAMFRAMQDLGAGVSLADYMARPSKHLPINQVEQVSACERVDNWKGRNCR